MSKILARAFVKLALSEDKQTTINTAESAQFCGVDCAMKEFTLEETTELKVWLDIKSKEHELQNEVQD